MDKIDQFIVSHADQIRKVLIPHKGKCPHVDLLRAYSRSECKEEERNQIERHLLSCSECLKILKAIKGMEHVENSPGDVAFQSCNTSKKIIILWDKIINKIVQVIGEIDTQQIPEFQPVRKKDRRPSRDINSLPHTMEVQTDKGTIYLEINPSSMAGYLSLKLSFHFSSEKVPDNVQVSLYQTNKLRASVYLDAMGDARFDRIQEGLYLLKFFQEKEILEVIELSVRSSACI